MYQTNIICNYKQHDNDDQEDMYRIQFLQIFDLNIWDDNIINEITNDMYNKVKTNPDITFIINTANKSEKLTTIKQFIGDDDITIFKGLFQYDLLDLFHICLCDLVNSNEIKTINKDNLINNL
jgi:hypothetical protein|tara:strand:+ start:83 stop:451 length:369 start_codon:yes stop_codon:yes gene_type:complete